MKRILRVLSTIITLPFFFIFVYFGALSMVASGDTYKIILKRMPIE